MTKSIKEYLEKVEKALKDKKNPNIDELIAEHLIKISFYQHERLIHFLVTMLFALITLVAFAFALLAPTIPLLILSGLLLALLIPYIFHYYFLENSVQKMYKHYDELMHNKKNRG